MSKPVIKVEKVCKDFVLPHTRPNTIKSSVLSLVHGSGATKESQHALRDVSFDVNEGEFFGIVGRNGSGKSTLLKMLASIYQPTKGKISVSGKLVPFIELGVGFNPELTGRENVYLNGAILGFSEAMIDAMYAEIVEFAELERFMDQKLKNYSSGMQVRLAFSVAIKAQADVLLIDEVLAVGDADFQRKCFDYFKQLKKNKKTVVFVTHDMQAVRDYCDRAILIRDGKIAHAGVPDEIADAYLMMFNEGTSDGVSSTTNRWGNGQALIEELQTVRSDKAINISFLIKSKEQDIDDLMFAIRVKDEEGRLIAGSSSNKLLPGKKLSINQSVSIQLENIFGGGAYHISITLQNKDGVTIYDNLEPALSFRNPGANYYPVLVPGKATEKS